VVVELTGEGNTDEDEELVQVDKVKFKQHPMIKGKQCEDKPDDANQQSHCESSLQIIVGFPAYMHDDFNVNGNADNVDEWVSDHDIIELSHKNPSKVSAAIASEVNSMSQL